MDIFEAALAILLESLDTLLKFFSICKLAFLFLLIFIELGEQLSKLLANWGSTNLTINQIGLGNGEHCNLFLNGVLELLNLLVNSLDFKKVL